MLEVVSIIIWACRRVRYWCQK